MRLIDADALKELTTKRNSIWNKITDSKGRGLEEIIDAIPSAEEESFEWCTTCKEYDQEAHCCHRWRKVIRETLAEIREEIRNEMG